VLDDNGIRPPVIAAGINLFGGPLGLIHKHVTGAIPIRRNTKDPAYLITLKAYVAEILRSTTCSSIRKAAGATAAS
jgi:glycerol-3-phosphate O-acyltransferase